ncbi:hypothetical protein AAFC00_002457 [Neodothiora populina]|uniref:Vacuolar protein-sorting-associated protein 36 n=1 Tax=Neodothiora populina TaxID=2781224 RepID=A0ABR3P8H1_9PEZI
MSLRHLDLTTALRPSLLPDETLLFVQDSVGLYEGKYKIPNYQNGHAYLTSHRACYVDNEDPRKNSVAVELRDVDRPEFYAGFLKSSPKITLHPKLPRTGALAVRSPTSTYAMSSSPTGSGSPSRYGTPVRPSAPTPAAAARDPNATWICPICSFSNPVPSNFDPSIANANTPLPPCLACGIKPPLVHVVKAAIAAMSNRPSGPSSSIPPLNAPPSPANVRPPTNASPSARNECPRCTFQNHPSLTTCEICGAPLAFARDRQSQIMAESLSRSESPGPTLPGSPTKDASIELVKFSFRAGGEKVFYERLKGALVQRKWLLQGAPPPPTPQKDTATASSFTTADGITVQAPKPRTVGIAGLERRGLEVRKNNELVIGSAFEDLEALMTSAREVIAMAERFASQNRDNSDNSAEASALLQDLGLVTTKDMLIKGGGSETLYVTELSRNLAEFLTDDSRGILRREGGIMSLVDLWAVFNRMRNGIELVSPTDFHKAAQMWDILRLPIRLRQFKSGLLVVQGRDRTDDKTIAAILAWLQEAHEIPPDAYQDESNAINAPAVTWDWRLFGRGVTPAQVAEHFGWSIGVASEELEMAEEKGALCREQGVDGVRFWENYFSKIDVPKPKRRVLSAEEQEEQELKRRLRDHGLL